MRITSVTPQQRVSLEPRPAARQPQRRPVMRAAWAAALAWAVSLGCVTPSARVRAEPNAASDSAGPEYKQLVQQALHEYELGNFSEAKVFFSQAHTLLPTA